MKSRFLEDKNYVQISIFNICLLNDEMYNKCCPPSYSPRYEVDSLFSTSKAINKSFNSTWKNAVLPPTANVIPISTFFFPYNLCLIFEEMVYFFFLYFIPSDVNLVQRPLDVTIYGKIVLTDEWLRGKETAWQCRRHGFNA